MYANLTKINEQKAVEVTKSEIAHIKSMLSYNERYEKDSPPEERFIKDFMNKFKDVRGAHPTAKILSRFSLEEMIRIVYLKQYEIMKTEDEKIKEYFDSLAEGTNLHDKLKALGVIELLTVMGKKVEGVSKSRIEFPI